MNAKDLAALLNGREYGSEITKPEEAAAKADGLVVVFGYSDDCVELRGAIHEEIAAYEGATFRICTDGILSNWPRDNDEGWSETEAEDYFRRKLTGFKEIVAEWAPDETTSWAYHTEIPHETFQVMEDGDVYCRGIVFALVDASVAPVAVVDLQNLRHDLLQPRTIQRDSNGYLTHPAMPALDEDVSFARFLGAFGLDTVFICIEDDCTDADLVERAVGDAESCAAWTPTPPAGEGWQLLEIYPTEDSVVAMFARPKPRSPYRGRKSWSGSQAERTVPWEDAAAISDVPEVFETMQTFAQDPTGDNGTYVVRAVMAAQKMAQANAGI